MRYYRLILFFIVFIGLFLHLYPLFRNSFYFTMDQGRDAVHVRELLTRGKFPSVGPESSIEGVYHGVGWYYFIAVGYALFGGNPAGAVAMLILLQLAMLVFLMPRTSLLVGGALVLYWPWHESSSYAFNPFPLVPLAILSIILLSESFAGNKKAFLLTAIPVGLSVHAHLLGAICFYLWYTLVGIAYILKKKISFPIFFKGVMISLAFFLPHIVSEIRSGFPQSHALLSELTATKQFFGTTTPTQTMQSFVTLFGESIVPYSAFAGITIFFIVSLAYIRTKQKQQWNSTFVVLSLGLWIVSLLFFLTNTSWRPWVTVYLPPVLYISFVLMLLSFRNWIGKFFLLTIVALQTLNFGQRYFVSRTFDPSILDNELEAVDWTYAKAQGQGFSSYHYLPSVLDYPYQYLYWWHGKNLYGYVPCEYASFRGSPKLFVPGSSYYKAPTKECSNLFFLIVEPNKEHEQLRSDWLTQMQEASTLGGTTTIGTILVEMRHSK